jgi:hypothetical protein
MIVGMRIYTTHPGRLAAFIALYRAATQTSRPLTRLLCTAEGPLNQVAISRPTIACSTGNIAAPPWQQILLGPLIWSDPANSML